MDKLINIAARLLMAQIFIISGFSKISGYSGTQGYMEQMGVPGILLPLVILTELGGGLALLFGFKIGAALPCQLRRPDAAYQFHEEPRDGWRLAPIRAALCRTAEH
ncbi:DoxX family protein [Noviherbaspirillum sp.]|uniref:DoxX family protein n=1 Tax=Noviherbaspirillum sp. TaxID=1926288 RepID=UPI002B481025|nr:DoxX family protein [Noviherbaspirillum sp.]HJV79870.1 DoxX family protein [Noviherbaspirillum sp.]